VFAIDAGSFLVSVIFVTAMRVVPCARPVGQRFWRDLAEGWREVRRHQWLTAGFLGYAVGNFGVVVYIVIGSLVAIHLLGGASRSRRPWPQDGSVGSGRRRSRRAPRRTRRPRRTLMCVPNFLVLMLVPEVRSVRRREPEPEAALSAL
jgi:hypothetical protein